MTWTEADLAYFAGIIDGEGCFVLHDRGEHVFGCSLNVGQTDVRLADWIRQRFGGNVHVEQRGQRHKHVYRWKASADDINAIVTAVLPYLVIKRDRAELMLAYRRTLPAKPYADVNHSTVATADSVKRERLMIHSQLRALNKRGA